MSCRMLFCFAGFQYDNNGASVESVDKKGESMESVEKSGASIESLEMTVITADDR